ncbi:thioredoxin family protein [Pontiellaceae bacterium B1224]|nr:thioredoxin family protein [Pontiellaceae bacterium B1224]
MSKKYSIAALIIAGALSASAGLKIGDEMVDTHVKMESTDDATLSLAQLKGEKGTLVIFTCNKCPFVEAWQDTMVELGNTYMKKGISVVFINSNDPAAKGDTLENMKAMAKKEGYKFPYLQDATSEVARNFGAKKTPDVFLFDANAKLVYQGAVGDGGTTPSDDVWLADALEALLAGTEIKPAQTKAVGCSIKFR